MKIFGGHEKIRIMAKKNHLSYDFLSLKLIVYFMVVYYYHMYTLHLKEKSKRQHWRSLNTKKAKVIPWLYENQKKDSHIHSYRIQQTMKSYNQLRKAKAFNYRKDISFVLNFFVYQWQANGFKLDIKCFLLQVIKIINYKLVRSTTRLHTDVAP